MTPSQSKLGVVVHTCNSSYAEGSGRRIGQRPTQTKNRKTVFEKIT
jgi:hypothetical protein